MQPGALLRVLIRLHVPLKAISLPEESDHAAARKRSVFRQDSGILFARNGFCNFRL
jgi:hypothetical protein